MIIERLVTPVEIEKRFGVLSAKIADLDARLKILELKQQKE